MKIKLLLFAHLKEIVGTPELTMSFDQSITGQDILETLIQKHSELASYKPVLKLSINGEYANWSDPITEDSEVALFPPVSGG